MKSLYLLFIFFIIIEKYAQSLRQFSFFRVPTQHLKGWKNTQLNAALTASQHYAKAKLESERQLKEESVQRQYHKHLDLIANGDDITIASLGGCEHWMQFAASGMTISPNGYKAIARNSPGSDILNSTYRIQVNDTLDYRGFATIPHDIFSWKENGIDFSAMATTMKRLVESGWPPVFIFLYDEPWKMMLRLFDLMCPVLDDDEATLEASMAAWSLTKPQRNTITSGNKEKVGANFGTPHRDITYNNCHNPLDGSPDILSLWVPLVDVDLSNGCMYCIPRDCDPQFNKDSVGSDQDPFSHRFPYAHVTPLAPIAAGTVNVWHPTLIHWGSACSSESVLPPRQSIAMAFRVREETRPSTAKEVERYGRIPFTKKELQDGGPDYKARLRMIAKSLMLYNVWYPTYDGLDISKFSK